MERDEPSNVTITGHTRDRLDVLVENMGRINFGANFSDFKVSLNFDPGAAIAIEGRTRLLLLSSRLSWDVLQMTA